MIWPGSPEAEAHRAWDDGDRRLMGYMTLGLAVPGLEPDQVAAASGDVRISSSVSCTSPPGKILQTHQYARRYNAVILRKLALAEKGSSTCVEDLR